MFNKVELDGGFMRKLVSLGLVTLLVLSAGPVAVANQKLAVKQTISGFSSTGKLTTAAQQQLRNLAKKNPAATAAECVGFYAASAKASDIKRAETRAAAACSFAKRVQTQITTSSSTKIATSKSMVGKVTISLMAAAKPVQSIDLARFDPTKVSATALAKVNEYLATVPKDRRISYTLKSGAGVSEDQVATEKQRIEKSTAFWSSIYSNQPTVFLYTGKDADWMVGELNALGNTFHDNLVRNEQWRKTGECSQSLAVAEFGRDYYINCQRPNYVEARMSIIAAHEFAHLPITTKFNNQPGGRRATTPTWVNEGGSEFFGLMLTDQATNAGFTYWNQVHINWEGQLKLSTRSESQSLKQILRGITETEAAELMVQMETAGGSNFGFSYSTGRWALELLIASYGVEKFFSFLDGINSSTDWKTSFANTYGMTTTDFYKLMTPYFVWLARNH